MIISHTGGHCFSSRNVHDALETHSLMFCTAEASPWHNWYCQAPSIDSLHAWVH